jgi:putative SOS response-associated peptidase YedK
MSWKLSRTVLRGGVTGNGGSLLDSRQGSEKVPFYIHIKDREPLAFAGVWDSWKCTDELIESCSILTTDANNLVAKLHNLPPVILSRSEFRREVTDVEKLKLLFTSFPSDILVATQVLPNVNNPRIDSPECLIFAKKQK